MKYPKQRQRAFLLFNMMIVLGLIGAFAVLAERVARISLQTVNKATIEQDELIRLERAMFQLREDVWNATSMEAIDKGHLRVTSAAGDEIDWQTSSSGELMRTEKKEEQRWADLNVSFDRQAGWLVVRRGNAEVALFQQAQTAGGAR